MNEELSNLIDKAARSLRSARRSCDEGDYDFAVSRVYYSIFYVSEALLLKKDVRFSRHAALIAAIHDLYVKTGEISKEFHQVLNRAFKLRQQGDYMTTSLITKEVAEQLVADVEDQLAMGIGLLNRS